MNIKYHYRKVGCECGGVHYFMAALMSNGMMLTAQIHFPAEALDHRDAMAASLVEARNEFKAEAYSGFMSSTSATLH